jgi:hypothetical protein
MNNYHNRLALFPAVRQIKQERCGNYGVNQTGTEIEPWLQTEDLTA